MKQLLFWKSLILALKFSFSVDKVSKTFNNFLQDKFSQIFLEKCDILHMMNFLFYIFVHNFNTNPISNPSNYNRFN